MNNSSSDVRPAFLVGAHRSGTTLLRLMLDHHPDVSVPGEFDFLTEIMADRTNQPTTSEYLSRLSLHRGFLAQSFHVDPNADYETLVKSFVQQLYQRNPAKVFVAVVHTGFQELARLWPDAKFVHMSRDPRDVAASAVKLGWAGNVYTGVQRWLAAESAWDNLARAIPTTNRSVVQFEKLIANPAATLRQLCEFLAVPYSPEMLNYHQNTTYDAPDPSLTDQWKRKLSPTEIGLVEGAVGALLQNRGYQPSGYDTICPSYWMKRRLLVQDRIARFLFRIKRFGIVNTVGVSLARRFKLCNAERRFQLRINEISKEHLK